MAAAPPYAAIVLMEALADEGGPHQQVGQLAQLIQRAEGVGVPAPVGRQGGGPRGPVLMTEANKQGWVVISMKNDWKRIFPFEK